MCLVCSGWPVKHSGTISMISPANCVHFPMSMFIRFIGLILSDSFFLRFAYSFDSWFFAWSTFIHTYVHVHIYTKLFVSFKHLRLFCIFEVNSIIFVCPYFFHPKSLLRKQCKLTVANRQFICTYEHTYAKSSPLCQWLQQLLFCYLHYFIF